MNVFNAITGINESKIFTKHISCKCECKFDGSKFNSIQKWNDDKCRSKYKNPKEHHLCQKIISGILLHVVVRMVNM